jgi:hypothetical protein
MGIDTPESIAEWETQTMQEYFEKENRNGIAHIRWINTIYWKLEIISCAYIERNREWFKQNVKQFEKIWKTIEQERINGYAHRAPIKRVPKPIEPAPTHTLDQYMTQHSPQQTDKHIEIVSSNTINNYLSSSTSTSTSTSTTSNYKYSKPLKSAVDLSICLFTQINKST